MRATAYAAGKKAAFPTRAFSTAGFPAQGLRSKVADKSFPVMQRRRCAAKLSGKDDGGRGTATERTIPWSTSCYKKPHARLAWSQVPPCPSHRIPANSRIATSHRHRRRGCRHCDRRHPLHFRDVQLSGRPGGRWAPFYSPILATPVARPGSFGRPREAGRKARSARRRRAAARSRRQ